MEGSETDQLLEEFEALWNSTDARFKRAPDSDFLRRLAAIRRKIPEEAEPLRRLIFYGLESKIASALDAAEKENQQIFEMRADAVIISAEGFAQLFRNFDAKTMNKWKKLYDQLAGDFDKGEGVYEAARETRIGALPAVKFSRDAEQRFYQVSHWAETQLQKSMRFRHAPENESALDAEEVLIRGIRRIAQTIHSRDFREKSESEREAYYEQKAEEIYKGVAAFITADLLWRTIR